jgi:hypothetical protein
VAAAIIFSSILISNFTLVSGEQQRFRLISLSAEERDMADRASVLTSGAVVSLLDSAQEGIAYRPFDCPSAAQEVDSMLPLKARLGGPGMSAVARLVPGPTGRVPDPIQGVQPFNGTSDDSLNFEAVISVSGASPDSSVTLARNESHVVSIPVRLSALTATCLGAFGMVLSSLRGLGGRICDTTLVGLLMAILSAEVSNLASASGLSALLSYWIAPAGCNVGFTVTVWQDQIQGPAGPFRFTVFESGSL